jgi:hypothetical protein
VELRQLCVGAKIGCLEQFDIGIQEHSEIQGSVSKKDLGRSFVLAIEDEDASLPRRVQNKVGQAW